MLKTEYDAKVRARRVYVLYKAMATIACVGLNNHVKNTKRDKRVAVEKVFNASLELLGRYWGVIEKTVMSGKSLFSLCRDSTVSTREIMQISEPFETVSTLGGKPSVTEFGREIVLLVSKTVDGDAVKRAVTALEVSLVYPTDASQQRLRSEHAKV